MMIWRPILSDPPLCRLWQLQKDGPYSIDDLCDMHEALDLKEELFRIATKKAGT